MYALVWLFFYLLLFVVVLVVVLVYAITWSGVVVDEAAETASELFVLVLDVQQLEPLQLDTLLQIQPELFALCGVGDACWFFD